jgi:hypothetical protein
MWEQKRGGLEATEYDTLLSRLLVFNNREVSETFCIRTLDASVETRLFSENCV